VVTRNDFDSCQLRHDSALDTRLRFNTTRFQLPVSTRLRFRLGFGCDLVPVSTRFRFRLGYGSNSLLIDGSIIILYIIMVDVARRMCRKNKFVSICPTEWHQLGTLGFHPLIYGGSLKLTGSAEAEHRFRYGTDFTGTYVCRSGAEQSPMS
jgi:hypothetical protein